jgi:hypothetical protein
MNQPGFEVETEIMVSFPGYDILPIWSFAHLPALLPVSSHLTNSEGTALGLVTDSANSLIHESGR